MIANVLVKPAAIYDPRPGLKPSPLSHRCIFVDDELDERIIAEMDAIFAKDRILGDLAVDIKKVREQPSIVPRIYNVPGLITKQHELSWLSRDDIIQLVRVYKECADELADRVAPPHIDANPDHLDDDLLGKIMVYADGDADKTVTAEIEPHMETDETVRWIAEQETLKRRIHLQILRPIKHPQIERFGDIPRKLLMEIIIHAGFSASTLWRCHLFMAGLLRPWTERPIASTSTFCT